MKPSLLLPVVAGSLTAGGLVAHAEFEVSAGISIQTASDFEQPLAANGAWVQVRSYGHCWRPRGVVAGWRPYCHGYWEWTDCGWYWVSDEPWAWACYHYGYWVEDPSYGWVWVPGVRWAPAWVDWRTGGDYIGWAPCGPGGAAVEPAAYVFVQSTHFHDHFRPDNVIVNNVTIINRTREIHNISREERNVGGRKQTVYVNEGPGLASVEKASRHKFSTHPVEKLYQSTARPSPAQFQHHAPEPAVQHPPRRIEDSPRTTPGMNPPERAPVPAPQEHGVAPPVQAPENRERPMPPPGHEMPLNPGLPQPKQVAPPGQPPHPKLPVAPPKEPPHPQPMNPPPEHDNNGHDHDQKGGGPQ